MKRKLLSVTVFAALILGLGINIVHKNSYPVTQHNNILSVPKDMKPIFDKIEQEEARIITEFEKMGIKKETVEQEYSKLIATSKSLQNTDLYKNSSPVSSGVAIKVKDMIKKLPIDQKNLYLFQTSMATPAASVGNILLINEHEFNKHSYDAQKFIVTHEMAHNYYDDSLLCGILEKFCKESRNNLEDKNPSHPLCQYSRMIEWRADMWACARDTSIRNFYATYCQESIGMLKGKCIRESKTHPTNNQRMQLAQALTQGNITSQTVNILFA